MKIKSTDFQVAPGKEFKLSKCQTKVKPFFKSKKHYHKQLDEGVEELSELQRLHYASNRYAILLIFQAMDAAGKDGAIRHVMSGVIPQGCQVFSFSSRAPKNWNTISSGARPAACRNADGSASSIGPITRKC